MSAEAITLIITGLCGGLVTTCTLVWFIGSQFSDNRRLMYEAINGLSDKVLTKFEAHERQDTERFENLSNRIWDIQVSNALKNKFETEHQQQHRQKL